MAMYICDQRKRKQSVQLFSAKQQWSFVKLCLWRLEGDVPLSRRNNRRRKPRSQSWSLGQCLSRPTVSSKHFHRNSYFLSQQPISLSVRRLIAPTPIQPPAHKVATALHLGTVESLHLWRSEMATIYIYLNVGVYVLFGLPNNNFFCSFVHDYKYFNIMAYLNIKQQDF